MGPKLYRVPIFFGSDIPSSPELLTIWQWARYNSLWLGSTVEDLSPIKKLHFWIGPQLFRVTMFFGSHVLRMKAEHYTSSLQPSWLFPVDEYLLTLWQRAQKQLRTQSSLMFNGGAGCKVLDHLHLCRVCLQLYKLPSDVTKHGMQLPSTYEPLLCSSCACICMSISSCRYRALIFFLCFYSSYIYIHLYLFISIYPYTYVFYICQYL